MSLPELQQDIGVELGYIRLRIGLGEIGTVGDDVADVLVDLLQLVLGCPTLFQDTAFTCSIGSCSERIFCTSSFDRYLAGSDMEWPR